MYYKDNINTVTTKTSAKDKYFIYCRKSTRPGDRQVESIPDQIKTLNEFAKKQKFNVIESFIESRSAYTDDARDVFNSMIQKAKDRGDVRGILFRYIDRATRNLIEGGYLYKLIESGVIDEVITPEATFNKNNFFYYGIEILKAKSYSDDISKKVLDSVTRRIEKGIPVHQPYAGYTWSDDQKGKRGHVPHPTYFPLMKKLFSLFLTGDYTVAGLAKKSVEMGIKNGLGRPIHKSRMYGMLKSPYYCGRFICNGKEYQGIHKPLINNAQHQAILELVKKLSRPKYQKNEFAFNGMATCGECGRVWYGDEHTKRYKNGSQKVFRYYRCSKRNTNCTQPHMTEAEWEKSISSYLSNLKLPIDYIEWVRKWLKSMKSQEIAVRDASLAELNKQYQQVNHLIDRVMDEKLSGSSIFDLDTLDDKYRRLKIQQQEVSDNINRLGIYDDEVNELTYKTFVFAERAKDLFDNSKTVGEKRKVLLALGTNLTVKDKKISIQPQIPFLLIENAVKKLKMPIGASELHQTILFEANSDTPTDDSIVRRGLVNDIRTYWKLNQDPEREYLSSSINNYGLSFAY